MARSRSHPRVCRDQTTRSLKAQPVWGSSPHHGGSNRWRSRHGDRAGHPRVGGEQPSSCPRNFGLWGSSPHTQEAGRRSTALYRRRGVIPANRGSRRAGSSATTRPRDHPRVRGEQRVYRPHTSHASGSSPAGPGSRWRPSAEPHPGPDGGITTYAGSSGTGRRAASPPRGHPRGGGAQLLDTFNEYPTQGSSPRARGRPGAGLHASPQGPPPGGGSRRWGS